MLIGRQKLEIMYPLFTVKVTNETKSSNKHVWHYTQITVSDCSLSFSKFREFNFSQNENSFFVAVPENGKLMYKST